MSELEFAYENLTKAKYPEDVFGIFDDTVLISEYPSKIEKVYKKIVKIIHPDKYAKEAKTIQDMAEEATKKLNEFYTLAKTKVEQGIYGHTNKKPNTSSSPYISVFKSKKNNYNVIERIYTGETCGIFNGLVIGKGGLGTNCLLKVPHSSKDNDLMKREADSILIMRKKEKSIKNEKSRITLASRIPVLIESIELKEPGSTNKKIVNCFSYSAPEKTGWYNLEEIHKRYPEGVSTQQMIFIWNRVLEALTLAHTANICHSCIIPKHIRIHAESHKGVLIDWSASTNGLTDSVPYIEELYREFYPDELINNKLSTPASDIYMAAWCMIYILGGNLQTKILPTTIPESIINILNKCVQPNKKVRYKSVETLYLDIEDACKKLYGGKKFVELKM